MFYRFLTFGEILILMNLDILLLLCIKLSLDKIINDNVYT